MFGAFAVLNALRSTVPALRYAAALAWVLPVALLFVVVYGADSLRETLMRTQMVAVGCAAFITAASLLTAPRAPAPRDVR